MEDAENLILIKIHILKAMFKNFPAEDVDEECINIEEIAESDYEKKLEVTKNIVLEIATDILGLLRKHNARMQTQRKEWWEAQKKGFIDEFKAHKRLVKQAVKRAKENEEVCLIKCEDKLIEIPDNELEDEESSYKCWRKA